MNANKDSGTKSFNRALKNLQGRLKPSFLKSYPHYVVPGYNLHKDPDVDKWDVQNALELFKEFPYSCELPKPLLPPARLPHCVLNEEDPALELLTIKTRTKDDIDRIMENHRKHKKDFIQCFKKDVEWMKEGRDTLETVLPRHVAELAEIIEADPDPQFEGVYNWYYTGGSLNSLQLAGSDVLLFSYANELVASPVHERNQSIWKPDLKKAAKYSLDETLYELKHNITNNVCRVLGRCKNHCMLYSLFPSENNLEIVEVHKQASHSPYISSDLNPIDQNKYCLLNTDRFLELWDVNRIKCLSDAEIIKTKILADNWASVQFQESDPNLIIFVDRCCLHHIDIRVPFERPSLTLCPKTYLETCENLSLNFPSGHNSHYQYLGAYHSLLMCDNRFDDAGVIQKWTHQFKSAPLLACVTNRNEEEIVVISSQLSGEHSIVLNNLLHEEKMHSLCIPYMPPSILETLGASRMQGKCLNTSMKDRLELCNVGTTLVTNSTGDRVSFFFQNSIGDMFYQCITNDGQIGDSSVANSKSVFALDAWEQAITTQSKTVKPLVVSEKVDMTHIYNAMKSSQPIEINDEPTMSHEDEPKWKQPIETLNTYVDILAPELLAAWDVAGRSNPLAPTAPPHQKVLNWLEKATVNTELSTQSQENEPGYKPTRVNDKEVVILSEVTVPEINLTQESYCPRVRTENDKKKVTKKRKYVSGF